MGTGVSRRMPCVPTVAASLVINDVNIHAGSPPLPGTARSYCRLIDRKARTSDESGWKSANQPAVLGGGGWLPERGEGHLAGRPSRPTWNEFLTSDRRTPDGW